MFTFLGSDVKVLIELFKAPFSTKEIWDSFEALGRIGRQLDTFMFGEDRPAIMGAAPAPSMTDAELVAACQVQLAKCESVPLAASAGASGEGLTPALAQDQAVTMNPILAALLAEVIKRALKRLFERLDQK